MMDGSMYRTFDCLKYWFCLNVLANCSLPDEEALSSCSTVTQMKFGTHIRDHRLYAQEPTVKQER